MELSDLQQLSYLIENLTTSGLKELDKPNLKKLKLMCKTSNEFLEKTFRLLFTQLEKDHSEIRLAAVAIIDELFHRSHLFRELLLDNFNDFLELTAGTNFDMPLPEPMTAATELMKKSMKCVHAWHEKYGPAYKKLVIGFNYLKSTKKFQITNADEIQTQIQQNALEERTRKRNERNERRLQKLIDDIDASLPDILSCVAEIEACFSLLVPKLNDTGNTVDNKSTKFDKVQESSRISGILSHDYSLEIDISEDVLHFVKVQKNEDNDVILENLRDREKVLRNSHLPKVKTWLMHLGMCGAPSDLLKQVIDLKSAILESFEKSKELMIMDNNYDAQPSTSGLSFVDSDTSSDEDFEEVIEKPRLPEPAKSLSKETPKTNARKDATTLKVPLSSKYTKDTNVWKPLRNDDNLNDPASYSRALEVQQKRLKLHDKSSEKPLKIKKIHPKDEKKTPNRNANGEQSKFSTAPVVPFGPDLLEWDEAKKNELKQNLSMGMARELDIGHRFWSGDTASKGDAVSEAALTALTTRSIAFTGEFEPVKLSCRAPLPSGKLCPRKDRFKCPFHGKIIPRDEAGQPKNGKERNNNANEGTSTTNNHADWQDPELLRELKAITGVDLKIQTKRDKKKKKKIKYENLTDVKRLKDTSRYRLQKKVLDPKSIKRVSETLDTLDHKRSLQKFGNNFNYALN